MIAYRIKIANEFFKSRAAALIFSIGIFIACFLISELLVGAEYEKETANAKIAAADYVNALKTKVGRELNALLFVSNGLSSYLTVYHQNLADEKINAILADLYSRTQHVRNLGIAVGYQIKYVYPLKSNEKAMGIDFRDLPEQWPQVKQAIDTHQGVLVGPIDLVQGGRGLIYRYPIFINGNYWGILSTVINTDPFLKAAFDHMTDKQYEFAIRKKNSGAVFFGNAGLFQNHKALISVSDFPGDKWEWAILHKTQMPSSLITTTRLMGIVISLLIATLAYFFFRERKALTSQAMQDSLTGLANRRLLDFRLTQTLARAKRSKLHIAIMFIDIDHFKKFNDTYGHDVGDELIKEVAKRLYACIREVDTVARVGGDEFVILLDTLKEPDDAKLIAAKIIGLFENNLIIMGHSIKFSLSIGVVNNDHSKEDTVKMLMKKADIALYAAKGAGRNGYRVFHELE